MVRLKIANARRSKHIALPVSVDEVHCNDGDELDFSATGLGPAAPAPPANDDVVYVDVGGDDVGGPPVEIADAFFDEELQGELEDEDLPDSDCDVDPSLAVTLDLDVLGDGLFLVPPNTCVADQRAILKDGKCIGEWTDGSGRVLGVSKFVDERCMSISCRVHDGVRCGGLLCCVEVWDSVDSLTTTFFKQSAAYAGKDFVRESAHHAEQLRVLNNTLKALRKERRKG